MPSSLHQDFAAHVSCSPDAIAVLSEDTQLTYHELNRQANQLAHHLRALGVGPDAHVAICVERSVEFIVALVAIIKVGGAYIPLDTTYPRERLAFMLDDVQAPVLLTQERQSSLIAAVFSTMTTPHPQLVYLDRDWPSITTCDDIDLSAAVGADTIAYVMYTSGSTGAPKGIEIPHSAITNLVKGQNYIQITPGDRIAQVSNAAFDAATFEIWGALLNGACLVIVGSDIVLSERFGVVLREQEITTLFVTTALFNQLARWNPAIFATLRHLLFGGEAVDPRAVRAILQHPPERLLHVYGPTETTTFTTWWLVEDVADDATTIPIGCPLHGVTTYVLNQTLQPVLPGEPGELYIGGAGLARGYLNRPDLTCEKFVPDPFSTTPGRYLYKTGDRVCLDEAGAITFLGRFDHQVKIRGFRIELEEIEVALRHHSAVRDAIVLVRETTPSDRYLVAYVASADHTLTTSDIRRFLQERLPDYMVPGVVVVLAALPLTPNGKVDRAALPVPPTSRPDLESAFVAPERPAEQLLAGIWADVLGLDRIGIHDNFFDLGGDSIRGLQVLANAHQVGLSLSISDLFQHPTIADLAARVPLVAPLAAPSTHSDVDAHESAQFPLTPMQQGLLFHTQLSPEAALYVVQWICAIEGALNVPNLQQAWQHLVEHHPVLRTSFHWEAQDEPQQVVQSQAQLPWLQHDWRQYTPHEQLARLEDLLRDDQSCGFDLSVAPLMRVQLIQLAAERYQLIWSFHHLILDGWSLTLLLQDLVAAYTAYCAGSRPQLAPRRPFRDYTTWFQGQDLAQAKRFWHQVLSGITAPTPFSVDQPRQEHSRNQASADYEAALPADLTAALQAFARAHQLTLSTVVQGAWALLLNRYSREEDVLFGTVVAGRPTALAGADAMVGMFVNTLPVRARIIPNESVDSWLRAFQVQQAEARQFEQSSLVDVQGWSDMPRGQPLFESLVTFLNYPQDIPGSLGCQISDIRVIERNSFPLTLSVVPGELLALKLMYDTGRFAAPAIARMAGHLMTLLACIATGKAQRLCDLQLLTDPERRQLLEVWNATRIDYPSDRYLHTIIADQAAQTPAAVALVFEGSQMTYHELNRRANQLAHHLRALGVGPDVLVGISMERSLELVVGLLGILKAGGAYLPLDPGYPHDRLAFMIADAQTPVILTQQHLLAGLSAVLASLPAECPQILCLDSDWPAIAAEEEGNPINLVSQQHLAYTIYTSGSTGKPKGAMNSHAGIYNRIRWMQDTYQLTAVDRVLQKTPFSFDVSVWEFFWPLMVGARLIIARPDGHRDSAYLVSLIAEQQISTLHFVPSMLQVFLEEPDLVRCTSLKRVFCSGEVLPADLTRRFFDRSDAELHNLYGPTEAAIDVTYWPCQHDSSAVSIPIGFPVANTQIYILDVQLQPVPIGVPGELHIGGVQVARGYLNRPDLTHEKFIPDPFCAEVGAQLYKTGDLARYREDGAIEYLGRIDHQVKLRGFRIELGEIEAVLRQHRHVRDAVVMVWEDSTGDKRLVSYVVPNDSLWALSVGNSSALEAQQIALQDDLRRTLQRQLPEYMVPSTSVMIDSVPLSPNGKVDRRQLPAPRFQLPLKAGGAAPPQTGLERTIAAIWQETLQIEHVGLYDNFFDLGGHSLLLARAYVKLREITDHSLTMVDLFTHPTIKALATWLSQDSASTAPLPFAPSQAVAPDEQLRAGRQRLTTLRSRRIDPRSS